MILSHKYRFIFIKTNKSAGTSIEIGLSRFCGETDIITPVTESDEQLRKELGGVGPQNYKLPWYRYGPAEYMDVLRRRPRGYFNHIPASKIRKLIGSDIWNSYFKFCFERNPWDRVVSYYFWRFRTEPRPSFGEFLDSHMPTLLKIRGVELYTIDGKVAVDKIYRFEQIPEELEDVKGKVGFPSTIVLPRAKASFRPDKKSYREILSSSDKEKIARLFSDEIRIMGYEF